jgi:DNA-binding CsgD family transcriptional regulator
MAAMAAGARPHLVERERELGELHRALARAETGRGTVVAVRGPAGIGKTALVDAAVDQADAAGWQVLRARGDELEQEYVFGIALQLFEALLGDVDPADHDRLFEGAAELARPLLDSHGSLLPDDSAMFSTLHGLHRLVANLSADRTVLVAVDDAHWADLPSLRWVHYLAKRIASAPIAVIVAHRPVQDTAGARVIRSIAVDVEVTPRPLTAGAVQALVADLQPGQSSSVDADWHRLTGGNPLLVHELLRSSRPGTHAADLPTGPGPLPTVRARLERLSDDARALIEAAAVIGDGAAIWQAARVVGLDPSSIEGLATELVEAALLDSAAEVRFTHPLVRDTVEAGIAPLALPRLHERAAELLDSTSTMPELIANHLLVASPAGSDRWVEVLRRAAKRARLVGSADDAATWLRRALAEEPTGAALCTVLVELAEAEAASGSPSWQGTLERAVREAGERHAVAEVRRRVGWALVFAGRLEEGADTFRRALDGAGDHDLGELRLELLVGLAVATRIDVSRRVALHDEVTAALATSDIDRSAAARALTMHLTYDRSLSDGTAAEVIDLGRSVLLHPAVSDEELTGNMVTVTGVLGLLFADDAVGVEEAVDRMLLAARRRSSEATIATASNMRAALRIAQGRIADALTDAAAAVEIMSRARLLPLPGALGNLAHALLERGDAAAALRALDLPDGVGRWRSTASFTFWLHVRGRVRLALGDQAEGIADLREACEREAAMGVTNPATIQAPFNLASALAASDPDAADAVLRPAEAEAERFGAPRAMARAARARAVLDVDHRIEHLRRAESLVADTPWGLERMATRVDLGVALRERGDLVGARDPLRQAFSEASQTGAEALARRARVELVAAGGRPRRAAITGPGALTPTERQVAELAASGRSNREIAEIRFVSVKAIEYHLANAYRKLGISRRTDLAGRLDEEAG